MDVRDVPMRCHATRQFFRTADESQSDSGAPSLDPPVRERVAALCLALDVQREAVGDCVSNTCVVFLCFAILLYLVSLT